jgi:hypothetical protein
MATNPMIKYVYGALSVALSIGYIIMVFEDMSWRDILVPIGIICIMPIPPMLLMLVYSAFARRHNASPRCTDDR